MLYTVSATLNESSEPIRKLNILKDHEVELNDKITRVIFDVIADSFKEAVDSLNLDGIKDIKIKPYPSTIS